ncbi:MAG: hypothetical protein ACK5MG_05205 [Bacteroidales bacterium]
MIRYFAYFIIALTVSLLSSCKISPKSQEWENPNEDVVYVETVFDAEKDSVLYFDNGMRDAGGAILLKDAYIETGIISCLFKSSTVFGIVFRAVDSDKAEMLVFEPSLSDGELGELYYYALGSGNMRKVIRNKPEGNFYKVNVDSDKWYQLKVVITKSEIKACLNDEHTYSFKPTEEIVDVGRVGIWGWSGFVKSFNIE